MKTYDLDKLANASGQELSQFLSDNSNIIGEVTGHLANLERLKGVSQAHALGFAAYLPEDYDVKQLDTHLSKKGYQMTVESLSAVLLVAASAAIVAGVGLLAWKLFKLATAKAPTQAIAAAKQKAAVEKMTLALSNIGLSGLAEASSRDALLERFRKDLAGPVLESATDADLLNNGLTYYTRLAMTTSGVNYWSTTAYRRGQDAIMAPHLAAYVTAVDDAIQVFVKKLVGVVDKASDITDLQLTTLLDDRRWDILNDTGRHSAVTGILQAIESNDLSIYGKNGMALFSETLESAKNVLNATATPEQIAAYDLKGKSEPIGNDVYEKAFKQFADLKKTGDYLERVKKNLQPAEGRGQMVIDRFKEEVEYAQALLNTLDQVEALLRLEAIAVANQNKAMVDGGKAYASAMRETLESFTSEQDKRWLNDALKAVYKDPAAQAMIKRVMKTESLNLPRPLEQVMVLEGHGKTQFIQFLKVVGVILLIGFAAQIILSLILAMTGVQSMAASFAGGVVYFSKNGKRITPGEACDIIAEKAKDRGLGRYGVLSIGGPSKLPFKLDANGIRRGFSEASAGLVDSLRAFTSALGDTRNLDGDRLKAACAKGHLQLERHIKILQGRLKDMKYTGSFGDPSTRAAIEALRDGKRDYEDEWFNAGNGGHDSIKSGIDTTWWSTLDKSAESHIKQAATDLQSATEQFSNKVKGIDKGDLEGLDQEAQEMHAQFIEELAYFSTLANVVSELTKKAIRDQALAMQVVKDSIKTTGESVGGVEQFEEEAGELVHYADPTDHVFENASATTDLYALEQYQVMVTEDWKRVMSGVAIVLGALFVIGVTASILTALFGSRRSSSSYANDRIFKKIELDMSNILGSEEDRARRQAKVDEMREKIRADMERDRKARVDALNKAFNGGRQEKEVKGERVYANTASKAAPTAPSSGALPSPVDGSNDAGSVAPESQSEPLMGVSQAVDAISALFQNPPVATYRDQIKDELKRVKANTGVVGMTCNGTHESLDQYFHQAQPALDGYSNLMDLLDEGIVKPTATLSTQSDPNGWAEANYDKLLAAIEKVKEAAIKSELYIENGDAQATLEEAMRGFHEVLNTPVSDEQLDRAVTELNPAVIKGCRQRYGATTSLYTHRVDDAEVTLKSINDRFNKHTIDNLEDLKGNRDAASRWMRRIEEFKVMLGSITRVFRMQVDFLRLQMELIETSIRVHGRVQKMIGDQMQSELDALLKIRSGIGGKGASATFDEVIDILESRMAKLKEGKE